MQITSRFTIAVHIITCIEYFKDKERVTSSFLAGSIGANPVIIRNVMSSLKEAGLIISQQGKSGMELGRSVEEISFFDIYRAVEPVAETGLFHFHENVNPLCPVGRNIHYALDDKLARVQQTMEDEMKKISISDVYDDVLAQLKKEQERG